MNAGCRISVDPDTLVALATHLRDAGSELSPSDVASLAIRAWLAEHAASFDDGPINDGRFGADALDTGSIHADRSVHSSRPIARRAESSTELAASGARGYQWKELFIPDGTALRMRCGTEVYHACVSGDAIVYHGKMVSPRQLTIAIAGDGRNAWRDLWLRFPGEQQFRPASLLRRKALANFKAEGESGKVATPDSPAATIAAAAVAMTEALQTALALVERSNAQSVPKYERRVDFHRRVSDILSDHAMYD